MSDENLPIDRKYWEKARPDTGKLVRDYPEHRKQYVRDCEKIMRKILSSMMKNIVAVKVYTNGRVVYCYGPLTSAERGLNEDHQ